MLTDAIIRVIMGNKKQINNSSRTKERGKKKLGLEKVDINY